ncbi:MAG TPA: SpoIIE family protein phosphatase [Bryobacteraceae bacterium]|jgi:sigma-B regulation protein RsbU (phosphoserine phosphatase)|nr:SpoIIE family protein phosphatase [Bryobacteraceae bacterium]
MRKGYAVTWRRIGGIEKAFVLFVVFYGILYFTRVSSLAQSLAVLAVFVTGLLAVFRVARRGVRQAIWRLRNRLIAAYLFIAVVPIVLILAMVGLAAWVVIGQMAVYLVNKELEHRETTLARQADGFAAIPMGVPETALGRFERNTRNSFPTLELLITGKREVRFPENSRITHPPHTWKHASGLIVKDGRLFAWAHAMTAGEEVTILAPIDHELLAGLVPGLGDVTFYPLMGYRQESHVPPRKNALDFEFKGFYPVMVPGWESPEKENSLLLLVDTRVLTVLSTVFQKLDWTEKLLSWFVVVAILFLLVEMVSLVTGVQLSRSITGAVHELYEGTRHVKEGDFSYRVPVKGNDQLAELTTSFNSMTSNLGRLIVVAKEKERLESELEIAREVQNQLFPKDVPFTKTLEMKGVCHPARMVSGDYYDFMALTDHSLAFAIGDVAGKGISAALLMATIQSTMRTQLSSNNGHGFAHLSAARMVSVLNQQLYATTAPEKYATFYFALYEESNHSLTYTNAGHLAPMLLRGADFQMLNSTGTVVGAFPFARYEERTVLLEHGDILVAYTDGIAEPENAYGEMFGEERLKDLVVKYSKSDSSEIIARSMEAVNQWTGSSELQDDMTMVVVRRI